MKIRKVKELRPNSALVSSQHSKDTQERVQVQHLVLLREGRVWKGDRTRDVCPAPTPDPQAVDRAVGSAWVQPLSSQGQGPCAPPRHPGPSSTPRRPPSRLRPSAPRTTATIAPRARTCSQSTATRHARLPLALTTSGGRWAPGRDPIAIEQEHLLSYVQAPQERDGHHFAVNKFTPCDTNLSTFTEVGEAEGQRPLSPRSK
ncbi:hypothetical protein HPG69_016511 [Diceros bicornis minor]|uniref:Uncharacterized protein n=1 Tax=Diceros bicornis minor TaxID=77932 RepID=A0A7J7F4T0_DICBM|nr:hypothetical protein HPG69_016511 [Diceros bicornis minor]